MKRWTFRILLCLHLGIVTTFSVAWVLALWATVGMPDVPEFPDKPPLEVEALVPDDWLTTPPNYSWTSLTYQEQTGFGQLVIEFGVNYVELSDAIYDMSPNRILQIERAGWPFYAVDCVGEVKLGDYFRGKAEPVWSGGFAAPSWLEPAESQAFWNRADARPIPYRPIFPGFIINTLFYAVIWFGMFFGISATRRALRRKRGLCPMCAYDLRGNQSTIEPSALSTPLDTQAGRLRHQIKGCPECGWNRKDAE